MAVTNSQKLSICQKAPVLKQAALLGLLWFSRKCVSLSLQKYLFDVNKPLLKGGYINKTGLKIEGRGV